MRGALALTAVAVLVCASGAHAQQTPAERRMAEQESRVVFMADELDESWQRSGALHDDPELIVYLADVLARLFPDDHERMSLRVHRSTDANAFALPNGSLYITLGLLARLTSESQLAMIVGHEGEHYLQRHGVRSILAAKQNSAAGMVFGMALGVPLAGALLASSSYAGFSRELERDADEHGFERVRAAGYAVGDAHLFFERMGREARALRRRDGSLFASHPKLTARAATIRQLAGSSVSGGSNRAFEFLSATHGARMTALEYQQAQRQYRATIHMLDDERLIESFPPEAEYYLGAAYRLRNGNGDLDRAVAHFERTKIAAPGFAPAWRDLGQYYMRTERSAEAVSAFERYLELAPDAADRGFIESYIRRLTPANVDEGDAA